MPNLSNYDNPTEDVEAEAFAQWLRLKKLPFFHVANESGRGRTAMLRTAKMKRMGQAKGVPDYFVAIPTSWVRYDIRKTAKGSDDKKSIFTSRLVAIELKRKKGGRVSPEQKQWIKTLNDAGIEAIVCRGFDEARDFIEARLPSLRLVNLSNDEVF